MRVDIQVIPNNAASMAKAVGPAPAKSRKQATPPAMAPDRLTPRRILASTAKPSVTAAAVASLSGDDAQACAGKEFSMVEEVVSRQSSVLSCQ